MSMREAISELMKNRTVRAVIAGAVILAVILGGRWYFFEYRPQVYVAAIHPLWLDFEEAVRDARVSNYQYDPYGTVDANFEEIHNAAERALATLQTRRPPTRQLRNLRDHSVVVLEQYVNISGTFQESFKREADYYHDLLLDLQNLLAFHSLDLPILRARSTDAGNYFEDTWKTLTVLTNETGRLMTRTELAGAPPDRLRDFHVRLVQTLRDIEMLSRQGMEEFRDFNERMAASRYAQSGVALANLENTLRARGIGSGATALGDLDVGAAVGLDVMTSANTAEQYFNMGLADILRQQREAELLLDYLPFLFDLNTFYRTHSAFAPPLMRFVDDSGSLSLTAPNEGSYARRWQTYSRMRDRAVGLAVAVEGATPPAQYAQLHEEAVAALRSSAEVADEALEEYFRFHMAVTDHRFLALADAIDELRTMAATELQFEEIWNLKDIIDEQEDISEAFEIGAAGWHAAALRYEIR